MLENLLGKRKVPESVKKTVLYSFVHGPLVYNQTVSVLRIMKKTASALYSKYFDITLRLDECVKRDLIGTENLLGSLAKDCERYIANKREYKGFEDFVSILAERYAEKIESVVEEMRKREIRNHQPNQGLYAGLDEKAKREVRNATTFSFF